MTLLEETTAGHSSGQKPNGSQASAKLSTYLAEHEPNYRVMVEMECRGCSPVTFVPLGRFVATSALCLVSGLGKVQVFSRSSRREKMVSN